MFAIAVADKFFAFTDHSYYILEQDGSYESVLLQSQVCDAGE